MLDLFLEVTVFGSSQDQPDRVGTAFVVADMVPPVVDNLYTVVDHIPAAVVGLDHNLDHIVVSVDHSLAVVEGVGHTLADRVVDHRQIVDSKSMFYCCITYTTYPINLGKRFLIKLMNNDTKWILAHKNAQRYRLP